MGTTDFPPESRLRQSILSIAHGHESYRELFSPLGHGLVNDRINKPKMLIKPARPIGNIIAIFTACYTIR